MLLIVNVAFTIGTDVAEPTAGKARPRVQTIEKIAQLLGQFAPGEPAPRLTDLAEALGWDLATTHRIAGALVEIRLLARHEDRYSLGPFTAELAAVYLSQTPRRRRLAELVVEIAGESGLTTQLGVLSAGRLQIVESCESTAPIKAAAMLGMRLPLHASAAGKAILAGLTDNDVTELVPEELERFTAHTLASRGALCEELQAVRETGLARVDQEFATGLYAVATRVPAHAGEEPSAITCVGPSPLVDPAPWARAEALLGEVTARLAR
jgi:DNA-binding IclR family transcriptional regulator